MLPLLLSSCPQKNSSLLRRPFLRISLLPPPSSQPRPPPLPESLLLLLKLFLVVQADSFPATVSAFLPLTISATPPCSLLPLQQPRIITPGEAGIARVRAGFDLDAMDKIGPAVVLVENSNSLAVASGSFLGAFLAESSSEDRGESSSSVNESISSVSSSDSSVLSDGT